MENELEDRTLATFSRSQLVFVRFGTGFVPRHASDNAPGAEGWPASAHPSRQAHLSGI
jgi:hypothetical protein